MRSTTIVKLQAGKERIMTEPEAESILIQQFVDEA